MELILRDEVRHIAFGWQCLDAWAPTFTPETVKNIEQAVTQMIQNVEFNGYRNLWLAVEGGSATPLEIDADRSRARRASAARRPRTRCASCPQFIAEDPRAHGAVGRAAADVRPSEARARVGSCGAFSRVGSACRQCAGKGRAGLPAGHADSQPGPPLAWGHEIGACAFGGAQKTRSRGEAPRPFPAPCGDSIPDQARRRWVRTAACWR